MNTTIGCPIPGASQPKEPARLIDIKKSYNMTVHIWMPLPKPPEVTP